MQTFWQLNTQQPAALATTARVVHRQQHPMMVQQVGNAQLVRTALRRVACLLCVKRATSPTLLVLRVAPRALLDRTAVLEA